MNILAVGINHKTSSIDIRERFFLQPIERELLLSELKSDPRIAEGFVLSTCNRTEVYANLIDNNPQVLIEAIFKVKKIVPDENLQGHFYTFEGRQVLTHLLRVTTGLDSLIIGEKQILGQMKEALEFSSTRGMMGRTFNILANIVLQTGKKVRRETQIDFGGSSVSWASVMMAQNILGSLQDKTVLILGSGKMGRLAVQQLNNKGVDKIYIMNRTTEKAEELARENGGIAVPFWDIKEILPQADACICSASCVHYLMDKNLVATAMENRKGRKLVCVDISVPRNIDPEVAGIPDVFLYTIDDLDKVVQENIQKRLASVEQVEEIISNKVREFYGVITKEPQMKKINICLNKVVIFSFLSGFLCWGSLAHADLTQIKAYKEAYPDAKPKCIDCHVDKMPKKEDGRHDPNDYGKAVIAAAKAAKIDKPTADTYTKAGSIEDFAKKAATK